MGHHRRSFAVRSLCVVVVLAVAVSIYKPFFMTTHLVDNELVSDLESYTAIYNDQHTYAKTHAK